MTKEVFIFMKEYVKRELKLKEPLEEKTNLKDAGLDSLDIVSLLFAIEEKFGIKVPDEDIEGKDLLLVENLVSFVSARINGR